MIISLEISPVGMPLFVVVNKRPGADGIFSLSHQFANQPTAKTHSHAENCHCRAALAAAAAAAATLKLNLQRGEAAPAAAVAQPSCISLTSDCCCYMVLLCSVAKRRACALEHGVIFERGAVLRRQARIWLHLPPPLQPLSSARTGTVLGLRLSLA